MNNPYVSRTWVDRDSEYPTRRLLSYTDPETLQPATLQVTVTRDEGTITKVGDPWAASNTNGWESRINAAFAALAPAGFIEVSGTLTAGSTSLTLSDASITTSSTLDFFTEKYGLSPETVAVASGSVTLTFEAQDSNIGVKVRVY